MLNLVLFGPPGAGKGTQSEKLINKYGLIHLSTGDILRSEIARGTDLGKKAKEVMDRGELVSDDIVIGMIESKLDDNPNAKGFIFDGFPRTAAQATALDDLLQKKGTGISGMLALEVDDEELVKRLLLRGKDSGRADDRDEDVIRRRIKEYNDKTLPLKKYYSEQGKFHSIHGIGSIDEIFKLLTDRITFLDAEMDLTSLETDLEHLDLTIQDFEVADNIEPELLLEIDAIKRAEAEEEEELKQGKTASSARTSKSAAKPAKKSATAKKAGAKKTKKAAPKAAKKVAKKKKAAAKPVKKSSGGKTSKAAKSKASKSPVKKAKKAASSAKRSSAKKVVKATKKKPAPKKAAKKPVKGKVKQVAKKAKPAKKNTKKRK